MTFKSNWEKTETHFQLGEPMLKDRVAYAHLIIFLSSYEIISGGCANLNIKLKLLKKPHTQILRIYLCDKDAAYREQKLAHLIKPPVPIPSLYTIGDWNGYRYAITEYMQGISLRTFLLEHPHEDVRYKKWVAQFKKPQMGMFVVIKNMAQKQLGQVIDENSVVMIGVIPGMMRKRLRALASLLWVLKKFMREFFHDRWRAKVIRITYSFNADEMS